MRRDQAPAGPGVGPGEQEPLDLDSVRSRLANAGIFILTGFGVPTLAAVLSRTRDIGWHGLVPLNIAVWLVCLATAVLHRKLPRRLRSHILVGCLAFMGVGQVVQWGPMSLGTPMLMTFCLMATVLFGIRVGVFSLLLILGTLSLIWWEVGRGHIVYRYDFQAFTHASSSWATEILAIGLFTSMLVVSLGMLGNAFARNILGLRRQTLELNRANLQLEKEIRDRTRMERDLRESEERFRGLVETTSDGIWEVDGNGVYTYVSPAIRDLLGYEPEEVIGRTPFDFMPQGEEAERVRSIFQEALQARVPLENLENVCLHRDGRRVIVETSGIPTLDAEGNLTGYRGIDRDVTERRLAAEERSRLGEQLRHSQKMEAVGTLGGGIAHDFNNLLTAILGYGDLLLYDREPGDPDRELLQEIINAADRGAELTRQLLTFSRKVESKLRPTHLSREVEKVSKLLNRTVPKMIEISLRLSRDLPPVNADANQVEQVLLNLAVNARDAMPDGGKLVIETTRATLDEEYCRRHLAARPGAYVLLIVSDTGFGMDRETQARIFEPFFTTKEIGAGTGLGLSMVYGIVESHNGFLHCYSEPGVGTAFKIYFPVIETQRSFQARTDPEAPLRHGTETILLVDDEKPIRDLGRELLMRFGYTVHACADGETGLELYRRRGEEIDLVILDLIMPGMGGRRCLERLLQLNPRLKVIIASGYSVDGPMKEALEEGSRGYISKPFDMKQMMRVVGRVLEEG